MIKSRILIHINRIQFSLLNKIHQNIFDEIKLVPQTYIANAYVITFNFSINIRFVCCYRNTCFSYKTNEWGGQILKSFIHISTYLYVHWPLLIHYMCCIIVEPNRYAKIYNNKEKGHVILLSYFEFSL